MNTEERADHLFLEAEQLLERNQILEGKELLLELLSEFPDYGKAHSHLGWVYQVKFSDYEKADTHFKLAMKYAPEYHAAYGNYASLLIERGKYLEMMNFGTEVINNGYVDRSTIFNKIGQAHELSDNLLLAHFNYKYAIKETINNSVLEGLYASLYRVKRKMNIFQRLQLFFDI